MSYWQLWHTDSLSEHWDLFPALLLPADESQEHDFAVHIIKFLSLQARRSSNSSVMIWSSPVLAILSSFVSHANILRLGLVIIPSSREYTLNGIAPKTDRWGTPLGNLFHSYKSFFYYNLLLLVHIAFVLIPNISTFSNDFLWSAVSNDLFQLQQTEFTALFSSKKTVILLKIY